MCSGCGRKFTDAYDISEGAVRDLPWSGFTATVFIVIYRVNCPNCGVKRETVLLLPGKAPFSKKFLSVVCSLETGEPLWFGRERKKRTRTNSFNENSHPSAARD